MVRVAPIKLQYNPRTLWFDPEDLEIKCDDPVVVKTARGTEFGHAVSDIIEVDDAEIKKLKTELKPVLRIASEQDERKAEEFQVKSDEALPVFKEFAAEANDAMRPVSVEFLFDGDKAVFYFEAEERVDFRELVRKLASHFHIRVDMRQIGVRDEARILGGIGHCGQELCCKRLGGEFCPVSIRMAKEQDLSLNPQKISGVCGRLMCCLRYEYDAYKEFKSRAPKVNAMVETPEGPAKVVELDVPKEIVSIKLPDGRTVKIPLADMESSKKGERPDTVGDEAFERATNLTVLTRLGDAAILSTSFTGTDKLGDATARKTGGGGKGKGRGGSEKGSQKKGARKGDKQASETRKPRRRRSKVDADGVNTAKDAEGAQADVKGGQQKKGSPQKQKPSSGGKGSRPQSDRKPRKRSNKGQDQSTGQGRNAASGKGGEKKPSGARPGQKSSGLRSPKQGDSQKAPAKPNQETGHRKVRRRSHQAGSDGGRPASES